MAPIEKLSSTQFPNTNPVIRNLEEQSNFYKSFFEKMNVRVPAKEETRRFRFELRKPVPFGKKRRGMDYEQKSILVSEFSGPELHFGSPRCNGLPSIKSRSINSTSEVSAKFADSPTSVVDNNPTIHQLKIGGAAKSIAGETVVKARGQREFQKGKRANRQCRPRYRLHSDKNHDFSDSDGETSTVVVCTRKILTSGSIIGSVASSFMRGAPPRPANSTGKCDRLEQGGCMGDDDSKSGGNITLGCQNSEKDVIFSEDCLERKKTCKTIL